MNKGNNINHDGDRRRRRRQGQGQQRQQPSFGSLRFPNLNWIWDCFGMVGLRELCGIRCAGLVFVDCKSLPHTRPAPVPQYRIMGLSNTRRQERDYNYVRLC